ncbi:hypothetical protein HDU96_001482 [Phlyctochytrium bullatum]|nr:hypothetical protein HDU96_001482 [Phlyctochytrium bullatum]
MPPKRRAAASKRSKRTNDADVESDVDNDAVAAATTTTTSTRRATRASRKRAAADHDGDEGANDIPPPSATEPATDKEAAKSSAPPTPPQPSPKRAKHDDSPAAIPTPTAATPTPAAAAPTNPATPPSKKVIAPIYVVDHKDSIAVCGDTFSRKDDLKSKGGRFTKDVKINGQNVAGWLFPKAKKDEMVNWAKTQGRAMELRIELAKSNRSICKHKQCKKKIEQDTLRFKVDPHYTAEEMQDALYDWHNFVTNYYHIECCPAHLLTPAVKRDPIEYINGWEEIPDATRDAIQSGWLSSQ